MTERRFTFDAVADLYDQTRPDYPHTLFDDVVRRCGLRSGDAVLELGCGTGQATRHFAERGFKVVALDPGPDLIRVARRNLAQFADVRYVESSFEA